MSFLTNEDQTLLERCKDFLDHAYAPHSQFLVASAVQLENGDIFRGSNQENAAFPLSLCAERVVLHYVKANYPQGVIKTIAITARHQEKKFEDPIPPCGGCRQVILEYEYQQNSPIRILLLSNTGKVFEFSDAKSLLPLDFHPNHLQP